MFFERKRFYKKKVKIMQNGWLYRTQERLRDMTVHDRKRRTGDAEVTERLPKCPEIMKNLQGDGYTFVCREGLSYGH